jgi:penicillin-binding protein 1A
MIPDASLSYLDKAGINRDGERRVALALGGLNRGVTPLEMAAAYVPFVNRGMYYAPTSYTKVLDSDGKVLLDKTSRQPSIVYGEQAAFLMTSMLQDVVKSGTGTQAALADGAMPTAGKTGTTNDNADRWFVGYTPYYVASTWYGYDNNIKKITLTGEELNNAMRIWRAVMEKVHENLEPKEFPMPDQIVSASVCVYSGKAPTEYCRQDPRGNAVRTEYFIKGTEPKASDPCDVHRPIAICGEVSDLLGYTVLAGDYCPAETVKQAVVVRRAVQPERRPGDPYPADWEYEYSGYPVCPYHTAYGIAAEYLPDGGAAGEGSGSFESGGYGEYGNGAGDPGGSNGAGGLSGSVGSGGSGSVGGSYGQGAGGGNSAEIGAAGSNAPVASGPGGIDAGGAGDGTGGLPGASEIGVGAGETAQPGAQTARPRRTPRPSQPAQAPEAADG